MNLDWQDKAECKNHWPELFFPVGRIDGRERPAAAATALGVCKKCPVLGQCANYALETNRTYGIWGGVDLGDNVLSAQTASQVSQLRRNAERAA